MDDKLFIPLTSSLDNLHALRDALTDAVQSGIKSADNIPSFSTSTSSNGATCASTLVTGGVPVAGKRKLQYNPVLSNTNVSLI